VAVFPTLPLPKEFDTNSWVFRQFRIDQTPYRSADDFCVKGTCRFAERIKVRGEFIGKT
jgi:hypothetical protein